jgi:pimeloyl-ACP methyl ester carboxylesterase
MLLKVKDINLFYEKTGQGKPIILLHGNGESHKIFDKLTMQLSENFTVYAIDSRGHGKSTRVRELDYSIMAEDIVEFIRVLNIEAPALYGFSDGGILGLLIAARYPQLLSKLIISGANVHPNGLKISYIKIFRMIYKITKSSKYKLMLTQPNISDGELKKIKIDTLVLAGSNDLIDEEHTKHIAESIPKSTLKIVVGESHSSYVVHSTKLYEIMKPFLGI